jgi:hypothetical protein
LPTQLTNPAEPFSAPTSVAKTYLTHFPVRSYLEADVLSKESTWKIMQHIRRAGARGSSADEISKDLNLPPSIVYSTLKELRRLDFIFTYPREKRLRNERKKRYVCERATWGKYGIDTHFLEALVLGGEIEMINERLKGDLLGIFAEIHNDFSRKKELRAFLPISSESNICPKCNRSHEAMEFFYAIILRAIDSFIAESSEFNHFLAERGYSKG